MSDLAPISIDYGNEDFEEDRLSWNLDTDGNLVLSLSRTTVVLPPSAARQLAVWVLSRMSA